MSETKTVWEKCDHGMCGPHSFTVHLNFGTVEMGMCDGGKEILLERLPGLPIAHLAPEAWGKELWMAVEE